jgi:hypothetical protein
MYMNTAVELGSTDDCLDMPQRLQAQHVILCFRYLNVKEMCMLRCSCSELRDMRVSWQDHSIDFKLGRSWSSMAWLHKDIVSMRRLSLEANITCQSHGWWTSWLLAGEQQQQTGAQLMPSWQPQRSFKQLATISYTLFDEVGHWLPTSLIPACLQEVDQPALQQQLRRSTAIAPIQPAATARARLQ